MTQSTKLLQRILEQNNALLVKVSTLEEHVRAINGEVKDTKTFKHGCPSRMKEIQDELHQVKMESQRNTIYIGVGIAVLNIGILAALQFI